MNADDASLLPGRLLRRAGAPKPVAKFPGVQIDDPRLADVLAPDAQLFCLYEGTLHGEGPVWQPARNRLLWSDVPNRRLLAWHPDGKVTVAIDGTYFMNGNAIENAHALTICIATIDQNVTRHDTIRPSSPLRAPAETPAAHRADASRYRPQRDRRDRGRMVTSARTAETAGFRSRR